MLVLVEKLRGMNDFVHERGLAVVNVGNDGYIPNVLHTKSFAGAKVRNKGGKTRVNQLLRLGNHKSSIGAPTEQKLHCVC
ncbi:hypothetical protein GCM10011383_44080 [Hymenobacter cavernae]|uniref:Uncharacterized protein n=1 Tax=Hymenobacter cavernae TaxID=2044852 RepID=A0ABQ1UVF8_9BACT|nr:hypothetical protein GCM10011383_44080 [Hymenobacter cavernae]